MRFDKIYVELSDICGLKCQFCPSTKGVRGIMPLDLFSKIALECAKFTKLITFHILGDPLKIKNLKEYLLVAKKYNLKVEITTSGIYVDEFDFLLESPIKQINFSLDAIMEVESKVFRDIAFNKIFEFCRYKDSSNNDIFINLRIQNRIDSKTLELKDILKQEFDLVDLNSNVRVGKKTIIVFRNPFLWNSNDNKSDTNNTGFCYGLISHFGILSNGDVVPCCIDAGGDIVLGNLKSQSLNDILYGNRALDMRNGFKNKVIIEQKCLRCDYRRRFNNNIIIE